MKNTCNNMKGKFFYSRDGGWGLLSSYTPCIMHFFDFRLKINREYPFFKAPASFLEPENNV